MSGRSCRWSIEPADISSLPVVAPSRPLRHATHALSCPTGRSTDGSRHPPARVSNSHLRWSFGPVEHIICCSPSSPIVIFRMLFWSMCLNFEGLHYRKLHNGHPSVIPDTHGMEAAIRITGGPSEPLNLLSRVSRPSIATCCLGVPLCVLKGVAIANFQT